MRGGCAARFLQGLYRVSVWRCGGQAPFLNASGTKWHVGFLT